ncbi:hypothetical protein COLO4_22589 [Corchorus olitorius]|uniref:Uncharacterized protein n=1 Tax=Corchorus olitorius TaxID=93759 RepID=A0A1R3IL71_9ROSI|nr:hypothetical protein COLO4_22589 [Corchorus olitorius]
MQVETVDNSGQSNSEFGPWMVVTRRKKKDVGKQPKPVQAQGFHKIHSGTGPHHSKDRPNLAQRKKNPTKASSNPCPSSSPNVTAGPPPNRSDTNPVQTAPSNVSLSSHHHSSKTFDKTLSLLPRPHQSSKADSRNVNQDSPSLSNGKGIASSVTNSLSSRHSSPSLPPVDSEIAPSPLTPLSQSASHGNPRDAVLLPLHGKGHLHGTSNPSTTPDGTEQLQQPDPDPAQCSLGKDGGSYGGNRPNGSPEPPRTGRSRRREPNVGRGKNKPVEKAGSGGVQRSQDDRFCRSRSPNQRALDCKLTEEANNQSRTPLHETDGDPQFHKKDQRYRSVLHRARVSGNDSQYSHSPPVSPRGEYALEALDHRGSLGDPGAC